MLRMSLYCSHCGAANMATSQNCFACQRTLTEVESVSSSALLNGRYQIVQRVGTGGFGAVYRAEDLQEHQRYVAIKQINLRRLTAQQVIDATDTFNREISLLTNLMHPHLPRIYDHFNDAEHWYLVMDFIEGETLEQYLQGKRQVNEKVDLALEEILDIGLQLCAVLDYLHRRHPPIIFRDLKPDNIMRTPTGQLYLIDFGIARRFTPGKLRDTTPLGSPGYAAPEQYGKAQTTVRSDIYSLGAVLHCLLTGDDPADKPFQFRTGSGDGDEGERDLAELIMSMVEREASQRPGGVDLVRQRLEQIVLHQLPLKAQLRRKLQSAQERSFVGALPPVMSRLSGSVQQQMAGVPLSAQKLRSRRAILIGLGTTFALGLGVSWYEYARRAGEPVLHGDPDGIIVMSTTDAATNGSPTAVPANDEHEVSTYHGHSNAVKDVRWSADGRYIASMDEVSIQIWDINQQKPVICSFSDAHVVFNAISWSPDENYIVSAGPGSAAWIWDVVRGNSILTYKEPNGGKDIAVVAWSPNGRYIASAGADTTVQVWDANTGDPIYSYTGHTGMVLSICWSPDSIYLVSGDVSGTMKSWVAMSGENKVSYQVNGGLNAINAVVWSPDGRYIASAGENQPVCIWEVAGGKKIMMYSNYTTVVAWSPDSSRLASASGKTINVWDVMTGQTLSLYRGHSDRVNAIDWSHDGKYIVSAGDDKSVQIWKSE